MKRSGIVSLLTDFGPGSVYVGQMHAVFATRAPTVRVVDLAHDCPPGGIEAAGYVLNRSFRHFPHGTVHVVVVDPGVGSARGILAAAASGHLFLAPDNGVLGRALQEADEVEVRRVQNRLLMNETISRTFHGRDVFAPVAAQLATGLPLAEVGPEAVAQIPEPGFALEGDRIEGRVLIADRFGNLITNVPRGAVRALGDPSRIRVRVGAAFLDRLHQTFSDVPEGVALSYIGSGDHLEVAVNGGRADELLGIGVGDPIRVERMP
jgi:S-adenosylmethionine hydrolase